MTSKIELALALKREKQMCDKLIERNKVLEQALREAYIALKKHENLDVDIVGEAMGILEEKAWG